MYVLVIWKDPGTTPYSAAPHHKWPLVILLCTAFAPLSSVTDEQEAQEEYLHV